jgi:hypothetical protein
MLVPPRGSAHRPWYQSLLCHLPDEWPWAWLALMHPNASSVTWRSWCRSCCENRRGVGSVQASARVSKNKVAGDALVIISPRVGYWVGGVCLTSGWISQWPNLQTSLFALPLLRSGMPVSLCPSNSLFFVIFFFILASINHTNGFIVIFLYRYIIYIMYFYQIHSFFFSFLFFFFLKLTILLPFASQVLRL